MMILRNVKIKLELLLDFLRNNIRHKFRTDFSIVCDSGKGSFVRSCKWPREILGSLKGSKFIS